MTTRKRIPTLTDDMRASFPAFVDEWTAIGRSTEPLDRDGALRGIASAYAAAKLAPPTVFFGVSPVGGVIMRELLVRYAREAHGVRDGVRDGVRAGVRAGVWAGVWAGVEAGVRDGVEAGVWDGVWAGVGDGVEAGVWDGVWAGVRDGVEAGVRDGVEAGVRDGVEAGVWDGVWAGVRDGVRAGVWAGVRAGVSCSWYAELFSGCHEAGWLSFYDWFRRNGLADVCAPLDGLTLCSQSAGWVWLHRGFAVVTDRPATLHDERTQGTTHRRRLHNATGPSVTYRDGWELYHWHGQLVPAWVINGPTIALIAAEKNTEIRRCAIESFGWDKYLTALGVQPVSVEPDPGNPGHELRLFDVPNARELFGGAVRLLVMSNASLDKGGSRRTFAETVPADISSAVDAASWQFGVEPSTYRTLSRAT